MTSEFGATDPDSSIQLPITVREKVDAAYSFLTSVPENSLSGVMPDLSENFDVMTFKVLTAGTSTTEARVYGALESIVYPESAESKLWSATLPYSILKLVQISGNLAVSLCGEDVDADEVQQVLPERIRNGKARGNAVEELSERLHVVCNEIREDGIDDTLIYYTEIAMTSLYAMACLETNPRRRQNIAESIINNADNFAKVSEVPQKLLKLIDVTLKEKPEQLPEFFDALDDDATIAAQHYLLDKHARLTAGSLMGTKTSTVKSSQRLAESTRDYILGANKPDIIHAFIDTVARAHAEPDEELSDALLQPTQLDWEVLPAGDLEEIAREIVASQAEERLAYIDLERLKILEKVRTNWGADKSFYARSKQTRTFKSSNQECPDEYIVLVLQETDSNNKVIHEHVVAESPIAGPNALYVYREDTGSKESWRDVMSKPKAVARIKGARRMKHTTSGDENLVDSMSEKIALLLACESNEFAQVKFKGNGRFGL